MSMQRELVFHIPERLRGIPLVTSSLFSTNKPNQLDELNDSSQQHSTSKASEKMADTGANLKQNILREIDRRQVNQASLLESRSKNTKRKVSVTPTTTKKPAKQNLKTSKLPVTTTTTTAKPITITTTSTTSTTKKPYSQSSKMLKLSNGITSKSERPLDIASSVTYHTGSKTFKHVSNLSGGLISRQETARFSEPDYQRRTSQATVYSKYTNRPNDNSPGSSYGGENWVLFNKPDGNFSLFESMVLVSNIMIVGTIIFVIVFGWIKSIQSEYLFLPLVARLRPETFSLFLAISYWSNHLFISEKRSLRVKDQSAHMTELGQSNIVNISSATPSASSYDLGHPSAGNTPAPRGDRASSRVSSMLSASVISEEPSRMRGSDSTINGPTLSPIPGAMANKKSDPKVSQISGMDVISNPKQMPEQASAAGEKLDSSPQAAKQPFGLLGEHSGQFKGPDNGIVSKAMAIVQPTENTDAIGELSSLSKLKEIKTTAQDIKLPSSPASPRPQSARLASEVEKGPSKPVANANNVELLEKAAEPINKSIPDNLNKLAKNEPENHVDASHLISYNSLDSIELPENLMQSIKKADVRGINDIAPSPNLLLGQTADAKAQPLTSVGEITNDTETKDTKPNEADRQITTTAGQSKDKLQMDAKSASTRNETNPSNSDAPKNDANNKTQKGAKKPPEDSGANKSSPSSKDSKERIERPRPSNPMGRDEPLAKEKSTNKPANGMDETRVKNHQVVVNKLDKRKTNLEIVDIRDESVTGKMGAKKSKSDGAKSPIGDETSGWISMDGVAVTQPASNVSQTTVGAQAGQPMLQTPLSGSLVKPSDIIGNRFNVDYKSNQSVVLAGDGQKTLAKSDSLEEQSILNNIETELEQDNKFMNRKYFVYIVHDGHLTARKECIARIEMPAKRRITLADLRQLIANSPDISLSSLKRNRFKFVTETYRLLNEDEDAAVLHQVYPTQGVFLKINIAEQSENFAYPAYRGARSRLSSSSNSVVGQSTRNTGGSHAQARTRSNLRRSSQSNDGKSNLPAIQVDDHSTRRATRSSLSRERPMANRSRGRSSGPDVRSRARQGLGARSRSGLELNPRLKRPANQASDGQLASAVIGRLIENVGDSPRGSNVDRKPNKLGDLSSPASDIGSNVISGAKKLFNATFHR